MKFNVFSTIIFLFMLNSIVFSQSKVTFFTTISYDSYSMYELKNLQKELLNSIRESNIPANITDSYPAYIGFQIGILIPFHDFNNHTTSVGGLIGHTSTGGRIHYQDYSGEIRADQTIRETSIGVIIDHQIHFSKKFNLGINFSLNYIFSNMNNSLSTRIGNETQSQDLKFSSSSFGLEPGLVPSLNFGKFRLGVSLSYLICAPSSLEYENMSNAYLVNGKGKKVNIEWSGFHVGIQASVTI